MRVDPVVWEDNTSDDGASPIAMASPREQTAALEATKWTSEELAQWLSGVLTEKYRSAALVEESMKGLATHFVDGETMAMLTADQWKELIPAVGPRSYAMAAVRKFFRQRRPDPAALDEAQGRDAATGRGSAKWGSARKVPRVVDPASPLQPKASSASLSKAVEKKESSGSLARSQIQKSRWRRGSVSQPDLQVPEDHLFDNFFALTDMAFRKSTFTNARRAKDYRYNEKEARTCARGLLQRAKVSLVRVLYFAYTLVTELITVQDVAFLAAAAGALLLCNHLGLSLDFRPTVVTGAFVFPIAFAINSAYRRRERALEKLATLKSGVATLLVTHACWSCFISDTNERYDTELTPELFFQNSLTGLHTVLIAIAKYLAPSGSLLDEGRTKLLRNAYNAFCRIAQQIDLLRDAGVPPTLLGRNIADVQSMMTAFETLRVARDYQTPITVKVYINVALPLFVLFTMPYFSFLMDKYRSYRPLVVALAVILYFLMFALVSVQKRLECPFGDDEDDINLADSHLVEILEAETQELVFAKPVRSPFEGPLGG